MSERLGRDPRQGGSDRLGSDCDPELVQRAIVLQLLSVPEPHGLHPVELRSRLSDISIDALARALLCLERAAVIKLADGRLFASAPARHLDRLALIAL